jgi:hypothetical protein
MGNSVGLAELIERAIASRLGDVFTTQLATVVTFDPGGPGQCPAVDVQPLGARPVPVDDDGSLEPEALPLVPNVPVLYLSGGGFSMRGPLNPGDTVLLVPLMFAIVAWRTGIAQPFQDVALHHLGNAVAIPCLSSDVSTAEPLDVTALEIKAIAPIVINVKAITINIGETGPLTTGVTILGQNIAIGDSTNLGVTVESPAVKLGSDLATEAVALASKVQGNLDALVTALGSATCPPGGGALGFSAPSFDDMGALKVKAE